MTWEGMYEDQAQYYIFRRCLLSFYGIVHRPFDTGLFYGHGTNAHAGYGYANIDPVAYRHLGTLSHANGYNGTLSHGERIDAAGSDG